MKKLVTLLFFLSFNLQATSLILIGGGDHPLEAMQYFVQKITKGPIFVLPWGTEYPNESFEDIKVELGRFGNFDVQCFCNEDFSQGDLVKLKSAGGIYFPGGDQNKIMKRLEKNNLKSVLHSLFQKGVPVAGTSAGTAIQSNPMLTGSGSKTSVGLGLLPHFIIDQHFLVREREGRLLEALNEFPMMNGLGVDESMSAILEDSKVIKALGPSKVILYLRQNKKLKKIELQDGQSFNL